VKSAAGVSMSFSEHVSRLFPEGTTPGERAGMFGTVLLFLVLTVAGMVLDSLWLIGLPFAVVVLYFLLEETRIVFFVILLGLPFAMELTLPGTTAALWFPTEPLLLLILFAWLLRAVTGPRSSHLRSRASKRIDRTLLFYMGALGLAVATSTIPVLSIKLFAVTFWYVAACYYFIRAYVVTDRQLVTIISLLFGPLVIFLSYALVRHAAGGFSAEAANESVRPFFLEHGSYAAYVSIVLGLSIGLSFGTRGNRMLRVGAIVTSVAALLGILFSYTRAAWLGTAIMFLFFAVIKAKDMLRFKTFVLVAIVIGIVGVSIVSVGVQSSLERKMTSIADVEQNLSNLERLNRWVAAINIIKAHPVLGLGYGTYPVHYETYRDRRLETPVSNFYGFPHNDYLQYWSEAGILGISTWLLFLFFLYRHGIACYYRSHDEFHRNLLLGALGGVLTYNIHALFNGFLPVDKVAVPFWVSIAFIVNLVESTELEQRRQ
jgi:putative inorganic carbon (HCO3(-)) transporter